MQKQFKITVLFSLLFLLLFFLLGRPSFSQVTDQQREQVSRDMLSEITREEGPVEQLSDEEKVSKVFNSLLPYTTRKDIKYRVSLVKSKKINAYALPNGQVVFYSGLLDALPKDDLSPLAFVAAHEISHIEKQHADKKIGNAVGTGIAIGILVRKSDQWVQLAAGIAHGIITSGYSRECETEADHCAYDLMRKANYDPNGALVVFKMFDEMEKKHPGLGIFPSHPKPSDRYKNTVAWLESQEIAVKEPTVIMADNPSQSGTSSEGTATTSGGTASQPSGGGSAVQPGNTKATDNPEVKVQNSPERNPHDLISSDTLPLPPIDYSNMPVKDIKEGEFLEDWERELTAYMQKKMANNMSADQASQLRARAATLAKSQPESNANQIQMVFLLDQYWTYDLFTSYLEKEIIPYLTANAGDFQTLGVAVKKDSSNKKHIVILLKKEE